MAISIGKLALYTTFGGIHPAKTLPIILDVGTNNAQHLQNELYLGWRHRRLQGADYDAFVEKFVLAIKKRYPKALLQWEDFGKGNASRILEKYRKTTLSFNDDIQGTGAVALAALFSAIKVSESNLESQRIVIVGGGSAGVGVAKMILSGMEQVGLSREDALRRIFIVDSHGLLFYGCNHTDETQNDVLHPQDALKGWAIEDPEHISLIEVITNARPTALIGVCGQSGIFTKDLIQEMAKHVDHPIVLPLSNPTSKAECTPSELIEWTQGRVIVATGSPFDPVKYLGKIIEIAQCNNVYIFPGIGLGALAAKATEVTNTMFLEAARILSNYSPALQEPTASLLPPLENVRSVSREIAIGVAKCAIKERVAQISDSEIETRVDEIMWTPRYPDIEPANS
jgi:malate dehydrogenase (oxaloacetate-decarboxylating)